MISASTNFKVIAVKDPYVIDLVRFRLSRSSFELINFFIDLLITAFWLWYLSFIFLLVSLANESTDSWSSLFCFMPGRSMKVPLCLDCYKNPVLPLYSVL